MRIAAGAQARLDGVRSRTPLGPVCGCARPVLRVRRSEPRIVSPILPIPENVAG